MPQQHASLVKYNNPILVSTIKENRSSTSRYRSPHPEFKNNLTPTEDILNSILPPREWTDDGHLWVQYVSSTPATASDVVTLQEQLDTRLHQRQARETGIDPVREELYAQCLDELIRQVTINCAERGLLLLRVRDEIRMTLTAYQTLYESSIAFGMRKALHAEQTKTELAAKCRQLEGECHELEQQVIDTKHKAQCIEEREVERESTEGQKHKEEIELLKEHNSNLRSELEKLLSLPARQ